MIEEFLCPGCISGSDTECGNYKLSDNTCTNHRASTFMNGRRIALGLPKGFNRVQDESTIYVFESQKQQEEAWPLDMFNLPNWIYEKDGFLFINVYSPRIALKNVLIIKGGLSSKVEVEGQPEFKSILLTDSDLDSMD